MNQLSQRARRNHVTLALAAAAVVIVGLMAAGSRARAADPGAVASNPAEAAPAAATGTVAYPDCTKITAKTTCEDTVCAAHGVTCYWDAQKDPKCTCVTTSSDGTPVPVSCSPGE